jgi:hypothetical protein
MIKIHIARDAAVNGPTGMERISKVCSKCKSPYWNKPRRKVEKC